MPALTIHVVLVRGPQPPSDDEPVEWLLLTSLPIETCGQVREIIECDCVRWMIENAFQEIEQALRGEVNTLGYPGYPQAALLAFGLALLLYNVIAVVKGALQAQHPEAAAFEKLSGYSLASEIAAVHAGMMIAIPPAEWTALLAECRVPSLVKFLKDTAAYANPKRFAKAPCGPKKPPPPNVPADFAKNMSPLTACCSNENHNR